MFDPRLEISVEEARQINPNYQDGDVLEIEVTPKDFGRSTNCKTSCNTTSA